MELICYLTEDELTTIRLITLSIILSQLCNIDIRLITYPYIILNINI